MRGSEDRSVPRGALGRFLEKLKTTQDGDGSLLDHSMILYGGGLGNGNLHDHVNLPVLLPGTVREHRGRCARQLSG